MTTSLSRRDLVVLAGAGLAASASRASANTAPSVESLEYHAPCEPYGDDAHTNPGELGYPKEFEAPYICIVYIDLSQSWQIGINYASFKINTSADSGDRLDKAKKVLRERLGLTGKPAKAHFRDLVDHPTHNKSDKMDFRNFGFKSKHELFFFFASENIEFDKILVVFTKLSSSHPEVANDKNYSFINAEPVTDDDMEEVYDYGRMFRMRNYMRDEGGDIDWKKGHHRTYSMNIHFKIKAAETGVWVPMVLDPDTGNGEGHEP